MATNLIITLGDRDIVLNKEIEGLTTSFNDRTNVCYLNDKVAGSAFISDNFDDYCSVIDFPILTTAIKYVIDKEQEIDKLILVATDQRNESDVEDFHKKKDTFNLALLVEKYIRWKFKNKVKQIKKSILQKNIVFHDVMYEEIMKRFESHPFVFNEMEDKVYLFAQSGIDAINLALLLNCIEKYPKTIQLNKPEGAPSAFPLDFPEKFYKRILIGKIKLAIDQYNYSSIATINYSPKVTQFANYAFARMIFDFDGAINFLANLCGIDSDNRSYYTKKMKQLEFNESGLSGKLTELYMSAKILLKRKAYSDFLVRIFSLTEILLKPKVAALLGGQIEYKASDKHKEWNKLLESNPDLLDHLENCMVGENKLAINYPNKKAYKEIVDFYDKKNNGSDASFDLLYNHLLTLSDLRNKVAHEMIKVNETDINEALKKRKTDLDGVLALADNYFSVNGMGDYDEINQKLLSML